MHLKRVTSVALGTLGLLAGITMPAYAAGTPVTQKIVVSQTGTGYESTLTINFAQPISTSTAGKIKNSIEQVLPSSQPAAAGPTGGAFLVCNQAHTFTDSDGTYSIQHACGGTTGPWGYKLSAGLCSIVTSPVAETGMAWTRNGHGMPLQAPHPSEGCGYPYHGTYNPEDDFDSITYSDNFTFKTEGGGSADLHINGSFYSARCSNPSVCP